MLTGCTKDKYTKGSYLIYIDLQAWSLSTFFHALSKENPVKYFQKTNNNNNKNARSTIRSALGKNDSEPTLLSPTVYSAGTEFITLR